MKRILALVALLHVIVAVSVGKKNIENCDKIRSHCLFDSILIGFYAFYLSSMRSKVVH